jgi:hypothetical protein
MSYYLVNASAKFILRYLNISGYNYSKYLELYVMWPAATFSDERAWEGAYRRAARRVCGCTVQKLPN